MTSSSIKTQWPLAVRWRIAVLQLVLCLLGSVDALAEESLTTRQAELTELQSKIKQLTAELESTRTKRSHEQEALSKIEREISEINKRLSHTEKELSQKSAQLEELQQSHSEEQTKLRAQRDSFGNLVRATYLMGKHEYLKMLLNQEDPSKLGRAIVYYRYLARARASNIEEITGTLKTLKQLEGTIQTNTQDLKSLREIQVNDKRKLDDGRAERSQILVKLDQRLAGQTEKIASLRENEEQLRQLVAKLRIYLDGLTTQIPDGVRFADMRGKLRLPSKGKITARFGQARSSGGPKWDGIYLAAPEGRPVRAIFPGRVIFADWFRGFGLLLILDHGDGYMTLYSHNKTLYKALGDSVDVDEVIGEVGSSGGLRESGLYFELRHNGQPRDPLLWCKRN